MLLLLRRGAQNIFQRQRFFQHFSHPVNQRLQLAAGHRRNQLPEVDLRCRQSPLDRNRNRHAEQRQLRYQRQGLLVAGGDPSVKLQCLHRSSPEVALFDFNLPLPRPEGQNPAMKTQFGKSAAGGQHIVLKLPPFAL